MYVPHLAGGYIHGVPRIDMKWNGALVVAVSVHNGSVGMVIAEQKMSFPPLTWPNAQKAAFWLILVTSVVLNIFFLGGYFRAGLEVDQVRGQGGAISVVADRLGLDTAQRALFQELRGEARSEAAVLRRANAPTMDSFWDELSKPHPDETALKSSIERAAQRNVEFTLRVAMLMRQFLNTLSADQQPRFIEVVRTRTQMRGRFIMGGR